MLNIGVFIIGWLVFVLAQAHNSVKSNTNGLVGWPGYREWLRLHAVDLVVRAFFSGIGYRFILEQASAKLSAIGMTATGIQLAGISGFSANALLYQIFGLIPWLRVEVGELAPPMNAPVNPPIQ